MEFLVEFEVNIPDGTPESEVEHREKAEPRRAAQYHGRRAGEIEWGLPSRIAHVFETTTLTKFSKVAKNDLI